MDTLIPFLREERRIRDAERTELENKQILEHASRARELQELKDQTEQCVDTISKNFNIITGHRHAISKVVHESKQCHGLPITNKHHKQTLDFLNDAVAFLNNEKNFHVQRNANESIDACKLSNDVQTCAQSSSDVFRGMKSSVVKVETLMQNIHLITDPYNDDEPGLERSIFDE